MSLCKSGFPLGKPLLVMYLILFTLIMLPVSRSVDSTIYNLLNETGTILIRTTVPPSEPLPPEVRDEFTAVMAFYAGMTRAMTFTPNPETGKPFSLFNYHAIERIVDNSGRFSKVSTDTLHFHTWATAEAFGRKLYHRLFGVKFGSRETRTISAVLETMGSEAIRMLEADNTQEYKAGHITFILEYLAGIPSITAKAIYIDCNSHRKGLKRAPWRHHRFSFFHRTSWTIQVENFLYLPN